MRGRNDEKRAFSLPTSSLLTPSPALSLNADTSLLVFFSPRVLAGGSMNCVLDNMSNRYTQYVCLYIGASACLHV